MSTEERIKQDAEIRFNRWLDEDYDIESTFEIHAIQERNKTIDEVISYFESLPFGSIIPPCLLYQKLESLKVTPKK